MKHLGRIKALAVTGAMVLGALTLAAAPAHAGTGTLSAFGGAGVLDVYGSGFTPGASVDLIVLVRTPPDADGDTIGTAVTTEHYTTVDKYGDVQYPVYNMFENGKPYGGPVWVVVSQLAPAPPIGLGGALWAQAAVSPPPTVTATQDGCGSGSTVFVTGDGFESGTSVLLELLQNSKPLATTTATGPVDGYELPTGGHTGLATLEAKEEPSPGLPTPAPVLVRLDLC
jgi:hypothetical protein